MRNKNYIAITAIDNFDTLPISVEQFIEQFNNLLVNPHQKNLQNLKKSGNNVIAWFDYWEEKTSPSMLSNFINEFKSEFENILKKLSNIPHLISKRARNILSTISNNIKTLITLGIDNLAKLQNSCLEADDVIIKTFAKTKIEPQTKLSDHKGLAEALGITKDFKDKVNLETEQNKLKREISKDPLLNYDNLVKIQKACPASESADQTKSLKDIWNKQGF